MSTSEQTPRKLLIQMSGAPGSGKSTIARSLRPRVGGVVIDHDILRSSLLGCRCPSTIPFDQAAKQAYDLQWALARDMMTQGVSLVIDSPCNDPQVLELGTSLAARHGYVYWYVECRVDDVDVLDRRLRGRLLMPSQRAAVDCPPAAAAEEARTGEDSRALFVKWTERPCRPDDHVIVVDSMGEPEVLCQEIVKQIIRSAE